MGAEFLGMQLDKFMREPESLEEEVFNDLKIYKDDVATDLYTHAQKGARWGLLVVRAEERVANQKAKIDEEFYPKARKEAIEELAKTGQKDTDKAIDALVLTMQWYRDEKQKLRDLEVVAKTMKKAEDWMFQRTATLQSLNGRQKAELGSMPGEPERAVSYESDKDRARRVIEQRRKG